MSQPRPARAIACPTCRRRGDWFAGAFGPFCSHRCKLLDLGKWLGEEHVIASPLRPDLFDDSEALPRGKAPGHDAGD